MNRFRNDYANDRAIEIYIWVLTQEKAFRVRDIPGWSKSEMNRLALQMLIDRNLVGRIYSQNRCKLLRRVDPSKCLELPLTGGVYSGVKRYRVPPCVAASMGNSPDLYQYAI